MREIEIKPLTIGYVVWICDHEWPKDKSVCFSTKEELINAIHEYLLNEEKLGPLYVEL